MTLGGLLLFGVVAISLGLWFPQRWRVSALAAVSTLALFALQPTVPIRHWDFWLPTLTLALTVCVWAAIRPLRPEPLRISPLAVSLFIFTFFILTLPRYLGPLCCLTRSRPPDIWFVALALIAIAALAYGLTRLNASPRALWVVLLLLLALFIVWKVEPLARGISAGLRALAGQDPSLAAASELRWLGFSYVAFRLLHTVRDRMTGKLPALTLTEFITYVIFFPTLTAGPIDRADRFIKDLRQSYALSAFTARDGGQRLALGLFKKFVLADSLAFFALNGVNATQATSPLWLWILLYAYAFRLYFDFSGYTDIALGLGQWLGFKLPENFDRPYLKPNLTAFWNSWHITLAQWFRAYFFNPFTRALRNSPRELPPALIIFLTQFSTMLLIGLWHSVTWNFVIWGAWHGVGLFIHNRYLDFMRPRLPLFDSRPRLKQAAHILGVLLTFHYVTLGWVWFALPDVTLAAKTFIRLWGI